jgi:hypothetical protein
MLMADKQIGNGAEKHNKQKETQVKQIRKAPKKESRTFYGQN